MINFTPTQLRKAADIQEKIQLLKEELGQILGGPDEAAAIEAPKKKRRISAAGIARIVAATKARWAKIKGTAPSTKSVPTLERNISAQGLANIRAAQKARWAKVKAAQGGTKTTPKRKFTAAGRARLVASARARWAKAKRAGKSRL